MSDLVPVRRALLSVSDKSDLIPFAKALVRHGIDILSTGGTAKALRDADVPVTDVADVTDFLKSWMDESRPFIHASTADPARRDEPSHVEAMETHGITPSISPASICTRSSEPSRRRASRMPRRSSRSTSAAHRWFDQPQEP